MAARAMRQFEIFIGSPWLNFPHAILLLHGVLNEYPSVLDTTSNRGNYQPPPRSGSQTVP